MAHWVEQWQKNPNGISIEDFIRAQVEALDLEDPLVDTSQRDDIASDSAHVAELIIADLVTYL